MIIMLIIWGFPALLISFGFFANAPSALHEIEAG
jgi:hypothetical protein